MAKLIIRQETEQLPWSQRYARWLSYGGLALLITILLLAGIWLKQTPAVEKVDTILAAPLLETATDATKKTHYLEQNRTLSQLIQTYEQVAGQGADEYQSHTTLDFQAQKILTQLNEMEAALDDLALSDAELTHNRARQAYLRDYWRAKQHFHELRVSHLRKQILPEAPVQVTTSPAETMPAPAATITTQVAADNDATVISSGSKAIAKPPESMKLPPGFCTLEAGSTCKPGE